MAEALVSFVLEKIRDTIWQELEEEAKLVLGVQKQVDILTATLRSLQAFLRDADVKQVNDAGVKAWVEDLKHIAYDAEDVLDEWRTTILRSQHDPVTPTFTEKLMYYLFSPCSSHITAFCSCFIPDDLAQHRRIANEIQGINERLDRIYRDRTRYGLTQIPIQQSLHRQDTSSKIDVTEICGREDDKKTMVDWLHGDHSSCTSIPVFAIVGTGGFGKTTLAQIVFNQEKTKFKLSIWVCVSETFDREKVAKKIIQGATGNTATDFVGWEALHQQLSDSIKGKQFLIVLDDVWSKNRNDWDPFRLSLDGGAQGSRVIVTTRDERVAMMMGSKTHRLGGLSKQDCWLLFQQIAFAERSQNEHETLKEIGKEIAAKCKGVPLAAKTIASLMRFKRTKTEWRDVLKSEIWEFPQEEDDFLPSILLSYHDLQSDLKQCFLYCAIFSKDEIIRKDMLVKLWMAQGFLGLDGDKELEIIGGDYFDDLAMRSFFQDFEEDDEGKIFACKMHDLVHDFAQFLTKTECSILETSDTLLNSEKLRHINAGDIDIASLSGFKVKKLRSLILMRFKPIPSELFCQVTCLRSLDLVLSGLKKLPDEVGRLLHLRYLDLSSTELTELPATMCNLYNLQTLRLRGCHYLRKLPEGIGRLLNLRHLECQYAFHLSYFPQGFGKLKHLRTLHKFVVSNASGGCKLEELKDLNLINGNLWIDGLRQVENTDEAKRAELQRKENIVFLSLNFSEVSEQMITSEENENNMERRMEEIIEDLQPHGNLEQLLIEGYPGLAFPSWMSSLPSLRHLSIWGCRKLKVIPNYLFSHNLRRLHIRYCPKLLGMPSLNNLPSLESLEFGGNVGEFSKSLMPIIGSNNNHNLNLKSFILIGSHHSSLPQGLNHFKSLQELVIHACHRIDFNPEKELSSEHFPNLRKLNITICLTMSKERCSRVNWSNLSHISEIRIE